MNAVHPNLLSSRERLDEIAELLASGLMRLHARQSSFNCSGAGEGLLDCFPHQSGHVQPETRGERHG